MLERAGPAAYKKGMSEDGRIDLLLQARAARKGRVNPELEEQARRRVWRPKEGPEVPYEALGDGHLVNILLMMRRRSQVKAQDAAQEVHLTLGPGGWRLRKHPQWDGLVEEGRRRGGPVARAVDLIDSDDRLDEGVIRAGIPRR